MAASHEHLDAAIRRRHPREVLRREHAASCSVPPSLTADDTAALDAAMRAGMAPAFWAARDPHRPRSSRRRRPHLRRAQRPRQPARASAAPARASARATPSRCCAATGRSSPRRGRPATAPGSASPTSTGTSRPTSPPTSSATARPRAFIADATHAGAVPPAEHVELRIAVGGELPGSSGGTTCSPPRTGADIDDPTHGHGDALHVGHHRLPEGRRQAARSRRLIVAAVAVRLPRRQRAPLHRAAVPRRARSPSRWCRRSRCGVPVVMMERWDAEETLALIEEHRVTHLHLVPTMFHRLLALPDRGARALRRVVAARHRPRRRPVPGAGEAGDHRVVRPDRARVLLRHRGLRHRRRQPHLAHQAGHRRPRRPRPPLRRRRRRRAAAGGRGGARVDQGHRQGALRVLRRRRQDRRRPTAATSSPSATSAASTTTASSSSPTAPPTSSSPAA